ncbi:hypothetical protein EIZ48_10595 [Photobacterium alginatilyticum]|uniref:Uncharacterized protein n=1 Tax=Photobacterium alginatilyticum TaxID=1775171 RepID=A0ABW9YGX6_9GAMM|nr:hypothetical protein [Photobacterium alginatilyticum]
MKPLKRYQYERYAILCNLAYPTTCDHTLYGFPSEGRNYICLNKPWAFRLTANFTSPVDK